MKVQCKAWVTSPEDSLRFTNGEIPLENLQYSNGPMAQYGWQEVGTAEIDLYMTVNKEKCLQNAIDALKQAKAKIYAEAEQAANQMEERIQRLLAIEDKSGRGNVIDA